MVVSGNGCHLVIIVTGNGCHMVVVVIGNGCTGSGCHLTNTRSVYNMYDPGSCGSLSEDFQSPTTLDPSSSALLCLPSSVVRSLGNRCLERFDYFSQNHLFTCLLCQGAKIKEIRDLTGAQINVSQESLPDSNERTVEVKMSQI